MRAIIWISLLFAAPALSAQESAPPQRVIVPKLGTVAAVTPGQAFYTELGVAPVPALRLSRTFKSSMAGSMGFPFAFSIDSLLLYPTSSSEDGYWTYFTPKNHAFTARHGLLGSVIRGGDTVGLRVGKSGEKEWFVDNSNYNHMETIWTRHLKDSDPAITAEVGGVELGGGDPVERLLFLGTDGDKVRVREEVISPNGIQRDDFTFPMDSTGHGSGAVKGAEFTFIATPQHALFTTSRGMSGF